MANMTRKQSTKAPSKLINSKNVGNEIFDFIKKLYPICRSITGNGTRETLKIINDQIPLKIHEVPTGTKVFDWIIPKEWNIKDAYIKNSSGEKIIDFKKSNLHVVNYSISINKKMGLEELKPHLHTIPEKPKYIPYLTSYYKEDWGFCLSHEQFKKLKDDIYEVVIDSSLKKGSLSYGEFYIRGRKKEEYLFTCYICHPSMCNDNLTGTALITSLAKKILEINSEYSYRFLFIPETIGAITWLSQNKKNLNKIKGGLIATCLGDAGNSTYKKTRDGNAYIDKIVEKVLIDSENPFNIINFFPSGSDERQFSSPAFNLPMGSLMRTMYGYFPEYHNSGDNLDFIHPKYLADTFNKYWEIISIIENNKTYMNLYPEGEPQLSKRGISFMAGGKGGTPDTIAMFWILNLSDGNNSLLDISIRSKIKFNKIKEAAGILLEKKLIRKI